MSRLSAICIVQCFLKQKVQTTKSLSIECQLGETDVKHWLYALRQYGMVREVPGNKPTGKLKKWEWIAS